MARLVARRLGGQGTVIGLDLNPHMLAVARAAAQQETLAVEWREGRAEQLPFPADSFDLVLSQFALMFFADRGAALAEMHRVLSPGGRLLASVWQSLDRHPFYRTLHEAIERRLGTSALADIFALGDAGALRTLLTGAGFRNVEIEPVSMSARFPDPDGFLAGEIEVDAAAIPSMQALDEAARHAIVAAIAGDMKEALRDVTHDGLVVLPFHAHIARAER